MSAAVPRPTVAPHGAAAEIYLHPGQIAIAPEPARITTILGSCVSVCLFDERRGIGGACHFQLPLRAGDAHRSARFGNVALELLVEGLVAEGSRRAGLQAKVFGGACVLDAFRGRADHLGAQNVDVALSLLDAWKLPVVGRDVGGRRGRKLLFHTDTGVALVRLL